MAQDNKTSDQIDGSLDPNEMVEPHIIYRYEPLHVQILKQNANNQFLMKAAGSGEGGACTGTSRQVYSWDDKGTPEATAFTADMWSDFPEGAPKEGNWVPAAMFDNPEGTPTLGFVTASATATENSVVVRTANGADGNGGGRIKASPATSPDDVVVLSQLGDAGAKGLRLVATQPDYATSPGEHGDVFINDTYLFVCGKSKVWRRVTLTALPNAPGED